MVFFKLLSLVADAFIKVLAENIAKIFVECIKNRHQAVPWLKMTMSPKRVLDLTYGLGGIRDFFSYWYYSTGCCHTKKSGMPANCSWKCYNCCEKGSPDLSGTLVAYKSFSDSLPSLIFGRMDAGLFYLSDKQKSEDHSPLPILPARNIGAIE